MDRGVLVVDGSASGDQGVVTTFEEEIRSQGRWLENRSAVGRLSSDVAADTWGSITHVVAAGRGSSDHAAVLFQYLAGRELGSLVALATPSLYGGEQSIDLRGAGVLAISQSGRTPGLVEVVNQARAQGRPTVVMTNAPSSELARVGDCVIDLAVGPERAVASTKTFSATWHAVVQLVGSLRQGALDGEELLPSSVDEVANWALGTAWPMAVLDAPRGITVIGRGVGYAVALEIALKVREVAGIRAEAFSVADYLHGPLGAVGDGSTLLVALTSEFSQELAAHVVDTARRIGMMTVSLHGAGSSTIGAHVDIEMPVRGPDWLVGLGEVIVGQVLALRLGERRHRVSDAPPGLAKVTLTA